MQIFNLKVRILKTIFKTLCSTRLEKGSINYGRCLKIIALHLMIFDTLNSYSYIKMLVFLQQCLHSSSWWCPWAQLLSE